MDKRCYQSNIIRTLLIIGYPFKHLAKICQKLSNRNLEENGPKTKQIQTFGYPFTP